MTTGASRIIVRAPRVGEGASVAALWRQLWDTHEVWGGYPGSRDPRVYGLLALRLDEDARVRAGHPALGRHVHLVAEREGRVCGQVEGWLDQHGTDPSTPLSCDVRSLFVTESARGFGVGKTLLGALASAARARQPHAVLTAEVLEPNPAHGFYAAVGYTPIAWSTRIDTAAGTRITTPWTARLAGPTDALPVACLEATLADRRRSVGDARFDRPRAIDATLLATIAAHLASDPDSQDPVTLVTVDDQGIVRATASFAVHALEPPFLPIRGALLGRIALDPASPAIPLFAPLLGLACRMALAKGATQMEIMDLSGPGTDLHRAALAIGATAWSRMVTKFA